MNRFRLRRAEEREAAERQVPLFVLLGALLVYYLRFGYDYATSDQDEVIPYLLHRLDPGVFTQDWFVGIQVSEFSVRTYFVWLLNIFSIILPVWLTVLLLYVVVWVFIAAAVYKLTYHFTSDQLAACAAVGLGLVFTPVWTLGGNDLVHGMLVASMVGWALGLWAVYHFLRSRYLISPVLLGLACWVQPLVGLHLAMLLFVIRVMKFVRDRDGVQTVGGIGAFGVLFALWASPSLGPIVYQQLIAVPEGFDPDPSLYYIMAEFRLPHHYLPASFYAHNVLRFALLAACATAAFLWPPFSRQLEDRSFLFRSLGIIAVFCIFACLFTEVIPVLLVAKLQLFKMTVFAKLLFVILICGAAFYWLPVPIRRPLEAVLQYPRRGLVIISLAWIGVITMTVTDDGSLRSRVGPFARADSPLGTVQDWAGRQTNVDAIFAIPPSMSSFRSEAQRTIVINYKAVPYEDEHMVTWFERLTDMAPVELPERAGPEFQANLDGAYERLTAEELRTLSARYEFDYVLRSTPLNQAAPAFEEAMATDAWYVYRRSDGTLEEPVSGPPADSTVPITPDASP